MRALKVKCVKEFKMPILKENVASMDCVVSKETVECSEIHCRECVFCADNYVAILKGEQL